ncbi:uncharacterized protein RMCC_0561 [Mycolicibacterium canariasense]|uniref:Transmembrane protein n=1 Tax=Mycolicibacterium canariasense TaxID=228230 RepID=A0A100W8R2_MYCCR|nr:hypothetical protein [Mycolicibacterium canariasense]ORV10606.1 hypothetical protein AWB94_06800 [Mycolicibacterium canariasense]GAS93595.1 uncharacterized protein RMCC_0561 [Mycolicibacterium canariasense]
MDTSTGVSAEKSVSERRGGSPVWLNWLLALLTVPVAMAVMLFAFAAVMGLARCTEGACPHMGPGEFWFGILGYGPPFVALAAIVASFFTASRKHAVWVPVVALGLLAADLAVLAITFRA